MTVEINQCNSQIDKCTEGLHCPPDVGLTPVTCSLDTPIPNCQITVEGVCQSCHDFYYLKNNTCLPCSDDCVTCYSPDICGVCFMPDWMEPTIDGICKQNCPKLMNNQYCDDGVAKTCQDGLISQCKCGESKFCASCSTDNLCASCLPGFKLVKNECQQCEDRYIAFEGLCVKSEEEGGGEGEIVIPEVKPEVECDGKQKVSVSVIIGGVIGGVILLCAFGGVVLYVLKKRQQISVIDVKSMQFQSI